MTKDDMMLGGPGLGGYAFHADVYCVRCSHDIIRELPQEVYSDYRARDSEEVPQPVFFGEADSAQHCGKCGVYLYGPQEEGTPTTFRRVTGD